MNLQFFDEARIKQLYPNLTLDTCISVRAVLWEFCQTEYFELLVRHNINLLQKLRGSITPDLREVVLQEILSNVILMVTNEYDNK
jgi:hypothetical protein